MKKLLFVLFFFCLRSYAIDGIDVSHHNHLCDFNALSKNCKFIYFKATEGENFRDYSYKSYLNKAIKENIETGSYLFYRPEKSPEANFRNFKNFADIEKNILRPMIDVEAGFNLYNRNEFTKRLKKLVCLFEKEYGVAPIIYCTERTYNVYIKGNMDECPVWIASFRKPNVGCLWQKQKPESIRGAKGKVDANYFINGYDINILRKENSIKFNETDKTVTQDKKNKDSFMKRFIRRYYLFKKNLKRLILKK